MVSVPNEALKNKQHEHLFIILSLWGQGLTMPFSTLKYYLTGYLSEIFFKNLQKSYSQFNTTMLAFEDIKFFDNSCPHKFIIKDEK